MPDGCHDRDGLPWPERQADPLLRLSQGERPNAAMGWPHAIEEVRDTGRSERHGCQALLAQALVHLPKLHGAPGCPARGYWRGGTPVFLAGARRQLAPSMARRIDLPSLYAEALRQAGAALADQIDRDADPMALAARLAA